ncbi:MAG: diadenylate cyclase CdaA [Rhodothermales bacterium]
MDTLPAFLNEVFIQLRPLDLLDVLLLAVVIYFGLNAVRSSLSRKASRRALAVFVVIGIVYAITQIFSLYLMQGLLEVLSIVVLVALVVVFQADIRRFVDRIGSWGARKKVVVTADSPVDTIAEASQKLAEMNRGALICIKGSEPWDRQVQGGIPMDGVVSLPLLISVFNPSSPGHDGAILIEGDRIKRFGAHLPLARHVPEISRFGGTRHAAGLGLAEQTDAFVIIVSEERGAISVAKDGEIVGMESGAELTRRLNPFWEGLYGANGHRANRAKLTKKLQVGVLSLVLAFGAWLLFSFSTDVEIRSYEVPLAWSNLPDDWEVTNIRPSTESIEVSLQGPHDFLVELDPNDLIFTLDLSSIEEGNNNIIIGASDLDLPNAKLRVNEISTREVSFTALPLERIRVPIEVFTTGTPPPDSVLIDMQVSPDSITLLVDPSGRFRPTSVTTEDLDYSELNRSRTLRRDLKLPEAVRLPPGEPEIVTIDVTVTEANSED